jgi:hypothetical protein
MSSWTGTLPADDAGQAFVSHDGDRYRVPLVMAA